MCLGWGRHHPRRFGFPALCSHVLQAGARAGEESALHISPPFGGRSHLKVEGLSQAHQPGLPFTELSFFQQQRVKVGLQ